MMAKHHFMQFLFVLSMECLQFVYAEYGKQGTSNNIIENTLYILYDLSIFL